MSKITHSRSPCDATAYPFRAATVRERWTSSTSAKIYPVVYLITFACYGGHIHGEASGSIDRHHNVPGTPLADADPARVDFESELMDQPPYYLDSIRRHGVLEAIQQVCVHRGWSLMAAHVRSSHVHAVVDAEAPRKESWATSKSTQAVI
jgi:hypothetical protein